MRSAIPLLTVAVAPLFAQGPLDAEGVEVSSTPAPFDRFGQSVALDGDTLAVGAPMFGPLTSSGPGRVEVLRGGGPGWATEAVLHPPTGAAGDRFGDKVALDGDTLLVGAPFADIQGGTSGAAYVFVRQAGVWSLQQQLSPPTVRAGSLLGSGVAVHGDRLVVGAPGGRGEAYVYERAHGAWTLSASLAPPGLVDPAHFGESVDLDGDRIVVSAPTHDGGGALAGAVFVYERVGSSWALTQRLDGGPGSQLGPVVRIEGDLIATLSQAAPLSTWLHLFRSQSGTWAPEATLLNYHGTRIYCLDLESGRVLTAGIGGVANLFERGVSGWAIAQEMAGMYGLGGHLSEWVTLDGEQAVIGAPNLDLAGDHAGGAYVFDLSGRGVDVVCESLPNSTGLAAGLGVEGTLGRAANDLVLHVVDAPSTSLALMTYGPRGARYSFGNGVLCIDPFGEIFRLNVLVLDSIGHARAPVDLSTLTGPGAIGPGESWLFQAWLRDPAAGGSGFNLTHGLRLHFTH